MNALSRYDLLAAHQCLLRAWLRARGESGEAPPDYGPRREDLEEVRSLARARFPGGVAVEHDQSWEGRVEGTKRLLANPDVPAIFDGCFEHNGVRARVGMLQRLPDGWLVVEHKPVNRIHEKHELDVAASAWIAEGAGLAVRGRRLLHLDRDYVRGAGLVDARQVFLEIEVERVDFAETAAILGFDLPGEPVVDPGEQCTRPRRCEFYGRCNPAPGEMSIHRLPKSGRVHLDLVERGIDDVRKIPPDVRLKPMQQHAVWSLVHGREYVGQALGPALSNVNFPLRFLDIECAAPPLPRWPGLRPFEPVPTQWSMHVLLADGTVTHQAFLHREDTDPREAFAVSLIAASGTGGNLVVYSDGERQVLRRLAESLPHHWGDIDGILDRVRELLREIRDHYYHPALEGSFSMKSVLPAVCPDLAYDDLAIGEGALAAKAWLRMVDARTPLVEREELAAQLLLYCERDTLGMLEVRKRLLAKGAPAL